MAYKFLKPLGLKSEWQQSKQNTIAHHHITYHVCQLICMFSFYEQLVFYAYDIQAPLAAVVGHMPCGLELSEAIQPDILQAFCTVGTSTGKTHQCSVISGNIASGILCELPACILHSRNYMA